MTNEKIDLMELVRLRKVGLTQVQLANRFDVSQVAIVKALRRAIERGLWDGKMVYNHIKRELKW